MLAASLGKSVQLKNPLESRAMFTRRSRVNVKSSLFGFGSELRAFRKEVRQDFAEVRQRLAAISDPLGRLAERAALEKLELEGGAEFINAYEVAWFLSGERADEAEMEAAVEKFVSNVIDQDVGAQKLLGIIKHRLLKDSAPTSELVGPVKALLTYLLGGRSPDVDDDDIIIQIKDATDFMDDPPSEPQEVLKGLQQLKSVLKRGDLAENKGWWQPFLEVLTMYYACKLKTDSDKLKEVVADNFVMFALPVALEAKVLRNPIEVLEVDLLWPMDFDGLGGCEIRIGEAKSRATTGAVREACRQLERSLLFMEWACKLMHGDHIRRISLTGVVAVLNAGPDKNRLTKKLKPNGKINFQIVKI